MNLNNCVPWLLGQGKNGPVPTVRSEAMREGTQDLEARTYLEKAWLDEQAKANLGEDLRGRIRTALDDRIHVCAHLVDKTPPAFGPEFDKRTELLFSLASEVASKYGGKQPQPNLTMEVKTR